MKILLVVSVFLLTSRLSGQTEDFYRSFDIPDGMRTSNVYDLFTDSRGFLYLGTELGLSRFNGIEFTHFPLRDNHGLAVHNITEDATGTLWCMNFGNQILYLENDTLRADLRISASIQANLRGFVVVENELWIASDQDIYRYDQTRIRKLDTDTLRSGNFQAIHYCPTTERIATIDEANISFYDRNGNLKACHEHNLRHVEFTCDADDFYFIDKPNPAAVFTARDSMPISTTAESNYVNRISKAGNELFLCSNRGLFIVNTEGRGLTARMFDGVRITDRVTDFDGGVWYSTIGNGIFYIPSPDIKRLYEFDRPITAVTRGENEKLYFGSTNGEVVELTTDGKIRSQRATNYITEIEFIYYDSLHHRLLTSHGIFDAKTLAYTPDRIGKSISPDAHGNFIVRSFNKVLLVNRDLSSQPNLGGLGDSSALEWYNNHQAFTLHDERSISTVWSNKHSAYFIGSSSGLFKIARDGQRDTLRYRNEHLVATGIYEAPNGRLFLSTLQHGLLEYVGPDFIPVLNTASGAGSNDFLKASWTPHHGVFLTTESIEYVRWLPTQKHVRLSSYYPLARLNSTAVLTFDNSVILATSDGLLTFPLPKEEKENNLLIFPPQLRTGANNLIADRTEIEFGENQVNFEIKLIDYRSMGDALINYRLIGHSNEWRSQHASNRWVRFISLPPGRYEFEVYASSPGRTSPVLTQGFTVRPPYWLSWWFLGGLALFAALAIMGSTYLILRQRQRKHEQQQLLVRSQLTALRSQMNPHFLFNALNSIQGMIYSNRKTEASATLANFAKLMRKILEFSEKDDVSLEEELQLIDSYLGIEAQRFDGNFTYRIRREHPQELSSLRIPTMIVQPFVENAVKHGLLHKTGLRELEITTSVNNNSLSIVIRDNGIGREASTKLQKQRIGKSFATDAIDSRLAILNKVRRTEIQLEITDLYDDSGLSRGTLVRLTIPLIQP